MSGSGPIFLPKGFKFSAVAAGIKASGKPDLALILAEPRTTAAALFTKNLVVAAPVEVGRASLARSAGRMRAVIVNSGNANCATGSVGSRACKTTEPDPCAGRPGRWSYRGFTGCLRLQL